MWKIWTPVLLETGAARNPNLGTTPNANSAIFYDNRRNAYHYPQLHQSALQNTGTAHPSGHHSSPLTQCVWTFFWLAVLIFIAYPIGICACELYVLLSPFSAFSSCFSIFTDFLLRLAHMPLGCAHNMIQAKPILSL